MDDVPVNSLKNVLPVLPTQAAYVCPGEDHPIPRSIHLARLAAYYPKCRECEHRHDTGQLPQSTVGRLEQTAARVVQPSPFLAEGVRGEYLNHLTRQTAGRVAAAVADRLWETQPLVGHVHHDDEDANTITGPFSHQGPVVVMGHDARPSSPDLCVGISSSLRRMGCEVVDIGRVTEPCHAFAVEHLQADAGLFVTGSGCAAQWTGIDFVGPRGLPWSLGERPPEARNPVSRPPDRVFSQNPSGQVSSSNSELPNRVSPQGTLLDIERRFLTGVSRATRRGGSQRYFDAAVPYRANLLKHFRDLRPLRIVCATADDVLQQTLRTVFESLPCDLIPIADPVADIDPNRPDDRLAKQLRTTVKDASAALAVAIAEDGQGICLFDEEGRPTASADVLMCAIKLSYRSRSLSVSIPASASELADVAKQQGNETDHINGGREALANRLYDPQASVGFEPGGRLWIKDAVPTCDAVLTIGLLLRVLSEQRQPMSTLFGPTAT